MSPVVMKPSTAKPEPSILVQRSGLVPIVSRKNVASATEDFVRSQVEATEAAHQHERIPAVQDLQFT